MTLKQKGCHRPYSTLSHRHNDHHHQRDNHTHLHNHLKDKLSG